MNRKPLQRQHHALWIILTGKEKPVGFVRMTELNAA